MNLLRKILNRIKEIFLERKLNSIKLLEERCNTEELDCDKSNIKEKHPKKDYRLMYKNIKNGIISMDDLMLEDLIKIMTMMNEEEHILDKTIGNNNRELELMNIELESLIYENNTLRARTNSIQ